MNIHPIFVHFPIALLTVYALLEIARLPILTRQTWSKPIKFFLLFFGTGTAYVTLLTGQIAENLIGRGNPMRNVVHVHQNFAIGATFVFSLILLLYILGWLGVAKFRSAEDSWITAVLALVGLILITITGALGGLIVFGADADPLVHLVAQLFK